MALAYSTNSPYEAQEICSRYAHILFYNLSVHAVRRMMQARFDGNFSLVYGLKYLPEEHVQKDAVFFLDLLNFHRNLTSMLQMFYASLSEKGRLFLAIRSDGETFTLKRFGQEIEKEGFHLMLSGEVSPSFLTEKEITAQRIRKSFDDSKKDLDLCQYMYFVAEKNA